MKLVVREGDVLTHIPDMPTQHNSPIYIDHHPHVDAGPVAVCRAAGALIYGKTVSQPYFGGMGLCHLVISDAISIRSSTQPSSHPPSSALPLVMLGTPGGLLVARPLALERPWGTGNATLRLARRLEVSPG